MQAVTDEQTREVIAYNLRRLRGERSLSDLGRACQTSAGAIRDIEQGIRLPGVGLLTRLADALGTDLDEFIKPEPKKRRKSA